MTPAVEACNPAHWTYQRKSTEGHGMEASSGSPARRRRPLDAGRARVLRRLHGRGQEQGQMDALIAAARAGSSAVRLLDGGVGTGKSALMGYARARATGMRVLRCHGDQDESDLPFAALQQL